MKSGNGRPKRYGKDARAESRSYWLNDVFIDQGWSWSTELVEGESVDGRRCWRALPICLEKEDDVVPILTGHKQIPNDIHPRRRAVLESM